MKQYDKEVGNKFGRLTVIGFIERIKYAGGGVTYKYLCKCECGKEITVALGNLRYGHTKSCGCYDKERLSARRTTHGLRKHPLYVVWNCMKDRCLNPNNHAYKNYGGRGICVSPSWMDFKTFYDWAMVNGYKPGLELDRFPDINGNYEPINCRFATQEEQQNNKRNNRKYLYEGEMLGLRQIARKCGLSYSTVEYRIKKQKRPIEKLLNENF